MGQMRAPLSVVALAVLAACGGGGSSSTSDITAAPPTGVSLSGTAATGMALMSAAIKVVCSGGTAATTTTDPSGSYSISLTGGTLPCMVQATGKDSKNNDVTLYSVIAGSGPGTAVLNITPLTDAVVAQTLITNANGASSESTFKAFSGDNVAVFNDPMLSAATNTVSGYVRTLVPANASYTFPQTYAGVFSTPFAPATSVKSGDSTDQALDALVKGLVTAAGTNVTFTPTTQSALAAFKAVIATATGSNLPTSAALTTAIAAAEPKAAAAIASAATAGYVSKLSPDQTVFESISLTAPGGAYEIDYFAPRSGGFVAPEFLYSSNEQLAVSPFTSGSQAVHYLPGVTMLKTMPIPSNGGTFTRYVVNGIIVMRSFPVQMIVSYPNGATGVEIDILASDGKTVIESTLRSNYQTYSLIDKIVNTSTQSGFYNHNSLLFTNTRLLSNTAVWQTGSLSVSFTNTNMKETYEVFDSNCLASEPLAGPTASGLFYIACSTYTTDAAPTPVAKNTTIAALMANGASIAIAASNAAGTTTVTTHYTSNMGTTKVVNGVNTYVAITQIETGTGVYRTFYELNGHVYVGTLVPANLVQNQSVWTNAAARDSCANAQNY